MNLLLIMSNFMPFILGISALIAVIAFIIPNKKIKKALFGGVIVFPTIYVFVLMGVAVPYTFLSGMFDDSRGIILMLAIAFTVWMIVSLGIKVKNQLLVIKNNDKDIYVRDIEVKYSPAVVSYLMDNKIETKKDLPATLLNLCAKNILKIQKDENGKINIIDLKNEKEVINLQEDEKYAYEMLVSGVTSSKIVSWKNKVEEEYAKYQFSKEHKKSLVHYIMGIYIAIFVFVFIYCAITGEYEITGNVARIISVAIVATFMGAWEMAIFSGAKGMINAFINRNEKGDFKDTYTDKGAREYARWKKFEKFIEDFSLINEKEHESVVLWGKYLSYSIALGINKKCDSELFKEIDKKYSFDYNILTELFDEE